jgi:S1-C subfamily serine protease
MANGLHGGSFLSPRSARSFSCLLTISCALVVHQRNLFDQHSQGVSIVRLPAALPLQDQALGVGRALEVPVRVGSLPSSGLKGWLGVSIQSLELPLALSLGRTNAAGAMIVQTTAGGPAALAGIRPGDILVKYNVNVLASSDDLRQRVLATAPLSL